MLVLEPRQLEAIERHMAEVLRSRLERVIATTFPELGPAAGAQQVQAAPLGAIVQRGIESAAKYGIDEPRDLAAFIALGLAWRMLPRDTPIDWIRSWLERPDTEGSTKLAIIEAQLADAAPNPALSAMARRVADARRSLAA
ncbi:MAG TPA: hypothetical protein VGF58_04975 [Burkholderiales bacterium]|jgi:hypothetical protein